MIPEIKEVVGGKKLAIVGVSSKKMSGTIYSELKQKGYELYPVHPTRSEFDGDKCYGSVADLPNDVTAAVLALSPEAAKQVVSDAAGSGLTHLWFQQGANFSEAIAQAEAQGLKTISKKCIMMYAEPVTGIHSFHRFFVKLLGRY